MCSDGTTADTTSAEPVAEVEATAVVEADDIVVATDADEMELEAQEGTEHVQEDLDDPEEFFSVLAGSFATFPYCVK